MVRPAPDRVLLIDPSPRDVAAELSQALPGLSVCSVPTIFDGIAELASGRFVAIVAGVEPIERRPEAAVRALREAAGESRLVLYGHPTLELLARKMLQFGADDYVVTPVASTELRQIFGIPLTRTADSRETTVDPEQRGSVATASPIAEALARLDLASLVLDALLQHPHDAPAALARELDANLSPVEAKLLVTAPQQPAPTTTEGYVVMSQPLRYQQESLGQLHLITPSETDLNAVRHALAPVSATYAKLAVLQERHNLLQRLAITDELTGAYNGRYFRHFLARIIERARTMRFPVSLLLFDIDDFKKYNDQYGHATGDDILKQTAALMKRCCRDHDLVARIGGDEFAVVFWEKEGPRQPREPRPAGPSRPPQTPVEIFDRFKRLLNTADFAGLGANGRGTLGISGGMAVYPYDASDPEALIKAADHALMFGAKQGGKNSICLVGGEETQLG